MREMLVMNVERVPKANLIGFVSYRTPWIHFQRNTDEQVLYIVKSGELHMRENGIEYVLKRGDMLLLEPGLDHEGTHKAVCDYYYFHFAHPSMAPVCAVHPVELAKSMLFEENGSPGDEALYYFPKFCSISDKSGFDQIMHASNELVRLHQRKHFNRGLIGLRLSELLIELSRQYFLQLLQQNDGGKGAKAVAKVHALLDYIHQHYTDKIGSALIEREFESNYDYLNRIFKQSTGYTITRYVNKVRIMRAQELIQATHLSFGEIGYLTGLNDPYYFSKVFKQLTGMSPAQYYKKVRE